MQFIEGALTIQLTQKSFTASFSSVAQNFPSPSKPFLPRVMVHPLINFYLNCWGYCLEKFYKKWLAYEKSDRSHFCDTLQDLELY